MEWIGLPKCFTSNTECELDPAISLAKSVQLLNKSIFIVFLSQVIKRVSKQTRSGSKSSQALTLAVRALGRNSTHRYRWLVYDTCTCWRISIESTLTKSARFEIVIGPKVQGLFLFYLGLKSLMGGRILGELYVYQQYGKECRPLESNGEAPRRWKLLVSMSWYWNSREIHQITVRRKAEKLETWKTLQTCRRGNHPLSIAPLHLHSLFQQLSSTQMRLSTSSLVIYFTGITLTRQDVRVGARYLHSLTILWVLKNTY